MVIFDPHLKNTHTNIFIFLIVLSPEILICYTPYNIITMDVSCLMWGKVVLILGDGKVSAVDRRFDPPPPTPPLQTSFSLAVCSLPRSLNVLMTGSYDSDG